MIMSKLKSNLFKQIFMNLLIIVVALVIFKGVSYSIDTEKNTDNKDLLIETGNMQVVLNVPKNRYEFKDNYRLGVSDKVGMNQEGYSFTITNTGNIPIEYYEIRIMDEENEISTLPHSYIRFTINKDNGNYRSVSNLGDVDNIIYSGNDLDVGKSASFTLKMWIDENKRDVFDKALYSALEVTLYQKYDILEKYVTYASDEGSFIPSKTSIYSPISTITPQRSGYTFLGWSTSYNGIVEYHEGDTYKENKGKTLYAIWEKVSVD